MEEKIQKDDIDNKSSENLKKEKPNRANKGIIFAIVVVIILIVCVIIELFTDFFSKSFFKIRRDYLKSKGLISLEGNTIGNIRNHGYVVSDDEYLYYMCPNEKASGIGIRRLRKDNLSGKPEVLIEDVWEITGLNYLDGYIYFVTFATPEASVNEDDIDNKIHKMKVDGTEHSIINDNEFNNKNYEIYAIDDKIYYIGVDESIYYMNLDGSNKTRLNDNKSGYVGITKDYIFFNKVESINEENGEVDFTTYMMNIDGTNEHPIIEDSKVYNINVVNDYIYYVDENRHLFRINTDGTDIKMISEETAYNLNVSEDGIYYMNYYKVDGVVAGIAVYRMDLDGQNITQLAKLDNYSENLGEFDDWLFITDNNDREGKFILISKDGKQTITLYRLDFSRFLKFGEDVDDSSSESTETPESTE